MKTKEQSLDKIAKSLSGIDRGKGVVEEHLMRIADTLTEATKDGKPIIDSLKTTESGDAENSIVQKGSNAVAFGENSTAFGTSSTNAKDRGITEETSVDDIIQEWGTSDPAEDKFAVAFGEGSHIEGNNCLALGKNSHAEGNGTIAYNNSSHSEGTGSLAVGKYAHAEGLETSAEGSRSHAEGAWTKAIKDEAHSEGQYSEARARASHAEGYKSITSKEGYSSNTLSPHAQGTGTSSWVNACSHAEGNATIAQGLGAHAEGEDTEANAECSHAEGWQTRTSNDCEHAEGKYNQSNTGTIHSIGIGTSSTRKNAFEILSNGLIFIYGVNRYDGINIDTSSTGNSLQAMLYQTSGPVDGSLFGWD